MPEITNTPELTPAQFDVIAVMIKSREPARTAAKQVLTECVSPSVAAANVGLAPQSVSNTLRRFRNHHLAIKKAYLI